MDIEDLKYILQQHAYIVGQSVLATSRLEGMKVENERAIQNGLNPPYGEEQFEKAMLKFPVDHNSIIDAFKY